MFIFSISNTSYLDNTTVIKGEALENDILEEVNVSSAGSFISVTD